MIRTLQDTRRASGDVRTVRWRRCLGNSAVRLGSVPTPEPGIFSHPTNFGVVFFFFFGFFSSCCLDLL